VSFIRRPSENYCPGISDYVRPKVEYKVCQECGGRIEIWSDEETGICLDCGTKTEEDDKAPSCLEYCDYADICKGIIMKKRIK
jgi:hypothetical protein